MQIFRSCNLGVLVEAFMDIQIKESIIWNYLLLGFVLKYAMPILFSILLFTT